MQISDLVAIGKLGNTLDNKGYISFKKNSNFHPLYFNQKDVFLLFKDHRVRYVTIDKLINDKGIKLRFLETEVIEEVAKAGGVLVTLPETDLVKSKKETGFIDPVGMKVFFNNKEIGNIIDFFNNSVYDILVVKTLDKKEIMIPDVDFYIANKDKVRNIIIVKNILGLLDLCWISPQRND